MACEIDSHEELYLALTFNLLTQYLAEYLTHFRQTYTIDALWDRDECVTIWGQKVM